MTYETCTLNLTIFSNSGSENSNKEPLEESDADRIPWHRWTILARDRHFYVVRKNYALQWWQTFSHASAFPALVEKHQTIFIFVSNGWNCHKAVQAVRTNRWDGRRKGCTSNSGVTKFIIATWPETIICRNMLLPKQFHKFHKILSDYLRYAVIVCIK